MSNNLTSQEEHQLITLLSKLEPGILPLDVFHALARLIVTATQLVVPFYEENGTTYVVLARRDADDTFWPNLLNVPGKIFLPSDADMQAALDRLYASEMPGAQIQEGPYYAGHVFDSIARGKELSIINYVILKEKPAFGESYVITDLPSDIMDTEVPRIHMAVQAYMRNQA
jgi:hypothetical protein